jgi:DNA-binding NtrC family response regulator
MRSESRETRKSTVVVVDDRDSARRSLGEMLRDHGYSVEPFGSAEAALAWSGLTEADCIVVDFHLPDGDGERLLEALRDRRASPAVVVTSARGSEVSAGRCLRAGAYHFAEKPLDDARFLACVAQAVERTRLLREQRRLRRELELRSGGDREPGSREEMSPAGRLHQELERTEKSVIETTLQKNGGEIGASARALGISRRALYERMRKYHLSKEDFRR